MILLPGNFIPYAIGLNLLLLILAIFAIAKSGYSFNSKTLAFLVSLLLPFIGSLWVIINISTKKRVS